MGIFVSDVGRSYIVTEFLSKGSLLNLLRDREDKLKVQEMIKMAADAAKGMAYLEELKIVHRDLAARNCLVEQAEDSYRVKVSDFGLSKISEKDNPYLLSDPKAKLPVRWTAPEIFRHEPFTSKSDVWSFGVVLWEIFEHGMEPYPWISSNQQVYEEVRSGVRLPCPDKCPLPLYQLMLKCWDNEPSNRPPFIDIIKQLDEIVVEVPIPDSFTQPIQATQTQVQPSGYQVVQSVQVARQSQLIQIAQLANKQTEVPSDQHDYIAYYDLETRK